MEQLYGPEPKSDLKAAVTNGQLCPNIAEFVKELNIRKKNFRDSGTAVHGSALQEVEQEREVAFEVESMREVQKQVHFSPLSFPGLHRDIRKFAETGRLAAGSDGYLHASMALKRTALGSRYNVATHATRSQLFVSLKFTRTVVLPKPNDNFLVSRTYSDVCP